MTFITPSMDRESWMIARLSGERAHDERELEELITECSCKSAEIRDLRKECSTLRWQAVGFCISTIALLIVLVLQGNQ